MGIIIRQSIKSTAASYAGVLLGALNIMVLFPKYFEDTQFGLTRLLLAGSTLLAQFAEFGGSNIINRYFPFFRDERDTLKRFTFWIFVIAMVFYSLIAIGIYIFREPILTHYSARGSSLIVDFFGYLFPIALFILVFTLLESYARSLLRVAIPAFLKEVYVRMFQLCGIVLYIYNVVDFSQFMMLFAASYATTMLAMLGYVVWLDRHFILASMSFWQHRMLKEVMIYGFYSILTAGVWRAIIQLDVIMLSVMDDSYADALSGIAVYSIASYIVTLIQLPQRSLTQISIPIISEAIKLEQWEPVKMLYKRVGLNQFVIGIFIFLGIWVNLDNLLTFLKPEYHRIGGVVALLTIGRLFDMATSFNGEIIMYSKYFRFNFWSGMLLIVTGITTNVLFIPLYGIYGAALATASTLIFINVVRIIFIYVTVGFLPFHRNMIIALIIGGIIFLIAHLTPDVSNVYLNFCLRTAIVLVIFIPGVYYFKVSDDINEAVRKSVKKAMDFVRLT